MLIWFYLPDYPETAKFLTEEERQFAVNRMGDHAPKGTDKHFDKADFLLTIKSWQFWAFAYVISGSRASQAETAGFTTSS